MSDVNENIERLISRSLDGMLDDEQQLELDRELIRNPDARQMADEYRWADELAAIALADFAGATADVDQMVAMATRQKTATTRVRRSRRSWLLVPGAIAAAILAMVIPNPSLEDAKDATTSIVSPTPLSHSQLGRPPLPMHTSPNGAPLRTVRDGPFIRRRAGTEWIGVVGDDGNVYWIEVLRSRTIRVPRQSRRAGGTFLEM